MAERENAARDDGSTKSLEDKMAVLSDPSRKKKQEMRPFINEQKEYMKHTGLCEGLVEMMFLKVSSSKFNSISVDSLLYEYSYDQFVEHANRVQFQENSLTIMEEKQRQQEKINQPRM